MKSTIRSGLALENLLRQIPIPYRDRLTRAGLRAESYTLLQFALDRNDVVPSRPVAKALARLEGNRAEQIVALGANFTREALSLLRDRDALVVSLGEFDWTDASYARIRQL